jgi:hypothetical protein
MVGIELAQIRQSIFCLCYSMQAEALQWADSPSKKSYKMLIYVIYSTYMHIRRKIQHWFVVEEKEGACKKIYV